MKTAILGNINIRLSKIGLGTSKIASLSRALPKCEALRLFDRADELGINFFDTADCYGEGGAEELLGTFCRGKRDRVIVSSKAGFRFHRGRSLLTFLKPVARQILSRVEAGRNLVSFVREGASGLNLINQSFDPDYIGIAIENSLRRLRTDYLDMFFLHEPPAEVLKDHALSELLQQRKKAGQIRCFGVSTGDPVVLGAAYFFDGLEIIQAPINPRTMPALGQALNEFAARGVGIVANQVFDSGRLLAGKVTESREGLIDFAAAVGGVSTIIIGTTNPAHLEENVAALERCS